MIEDKTLDELLKDIEMGIGPYDRDTLTHAVNAITHMKECGKVIREKLKEILKEEDWNK